MFNTIFQDGFLIPFIFMILSSFVGYTIGTTESTVDILSRCKGETTVETLANGKTLIKCSNFEYEL